MEMERKEREEEETRWRDGVTYKKLFSHRCTKNFAVHNRSYLSTGLLCIFPNAPVDSAEICEIRTVSAQVPNKQPEIHERETRELSKAAVTPIAPATPMASAPFEWVGAAVELLEPADLPAEFVAPVAAVLALVLVLPGAGVLAAPTNCTG
jgi:hypothetical protein